MSPNTAAPEIVRSQQLERDEHRHLVLTYRRRGMTWEQIADTLFKHHNIERTANGCRLLVKRYLNKMASEDRESAAELRELENQRLDELVRVYGPKARDGDLKAAMLLLKVSERRAKMNGLDAPIEVKHSGDVNLLLELGTDPRALAEEREAFETAFGSIGLDDPARQIDIAEADVVEDDDYELADAE